MTLFLPRSPLEPSDFVSTSRSCLGRDSWRLQGEAVAAGREGQCQRTICHLALGWGVQLGWGDSVYPSGRMGWVHTGGTPLGSHSLYCLPPFQEPQLFLELGKLGALGVEGTQPGRADCLVAWGAWGGRGEEPAVPTGAEESAVKELPRGVCRLGPSSACVARVVAELTWILFPHH